MTSIAVTGAAGSVGRRLVALLAADAEVERVVAIDRRSMGSPRSAQSGTDTIVEYLGIDVAVDDPAPALDGIDAVVHLIDEPTRDGRKQMARLALGRVLEGAEAGGCGHAVVVSSSLVYGASPQNPIPITEAQPVGSDHTLAYVAAKANLESQARSWAETNRSTLAVLRPAAAVSEGDSSWVGRALQAAAMVRPVSSPLQFLHHDDLASAVRLAAVKRLDGTFNVAPDGWIGVDELRRLKGQTDVQLPTWLDRGRRRLVRAVADGRVLDGLEPYVTWPCVVANDRLRAAGWQPSVTNQEAFVAGTLPSLPAMVGQHGRRQELALGAAGASALAIGGAALWVARRLGR